jgi:aryl-alcohol dehydrogenase-like predicted oxidoreductase
MTFGWEPDDFGSTEEESREILFKALDLGINFLDTANVYGRGSSESILGRALDKELRKRLIISSKCHGPMDDTDPNAWGNSRRNIIQSCEESLKRLNTEWIDLYFIHRPQPSIPIDETLRALDDLIHQGKVRAIGCSTFAAWQVCEAHYVAQSLGTNGFSCEQPPYNLLDRRIERELLPFCRTYDYGVMCWSPLASGQLSGKYLHGIPERSRYTKGDPFGRLQQKNAPTIQKLKELAEENGVSLTTLSLAWVTSQPGIASAIIGARSITQLEENIAACQVKLSDNILQEIDAIVPPSSYFVDYYRAEFGPNARPNC